MREYFEAKHGELPNWRTMLHLFQADRELLLQQKILPALQEGKHIVSDRCWLSTLVYQATSAQHEGEDHDKVASHIISMNAHVRSPDLTILLEIPFEVALERRRSRAVTAVTEDHFERRRKFMQDVHKAYQRADGRGILRIDANRPMEEVENDVFSAASALL